MYGKHEEVMLEACFPLVMWECVQCNKEGMFKYKVLIL